METISRLLTDILDPLVPIYSLGLSNGWIYVRFSVAVFILLAIVMSVVSIMMRLEKKPTPNTSEILWIINYQIFDNMFLWLLVVSALWPIGILFFILMSVSVLLYFPSFCLKLAYFYLLKPVKS